MFEKEGNKFFQIVRGQYPRKRKHAQEEKKVNNLRKVQASLMVSSVTNYNTYSFNLIVVRIIGSQIQLHLLTLTIINN